MANARIRQNTADPRSYAEEPHVTVCWAGFDKSAGRNGADALLPFVQGGFVFIRHRTVTATDVVNCGDLPANLAVMGVYNLGVIAAGTATLALEAITGGPGAHTLANAQSLTSVGAKTATPILNTATRKLTMTLASATTGVDVTLALHVCPFDKAYS